MASVKLALWAGRVGSSSRRVALSRGSWKTVSVAVLLHVTCIPSTLLPHSSWSCLTHLRPYERNFIFLDTSLTWKLCKIGVVVVKTVQTCL